MIKYILKNIIRILIYCLFVLSVAHISGHVQAATLKFDKTTVTTDVNQTVDLQVQIDAASDQILGVDSYIVYDPQYFEPQNVANGTYFPTVLNNIFSGKVYIAGIVNDPSTFKTGAGTLATVTFKALKNGSGKISFYCSDGASDSSKILKNDTNATNVIDCANNGSASFTIGTGAAAPGPSSTPAPTISRLPQTGLLDSFGSYTIPGALLLLVGIGVKIFLL